MAVEGPNWLLTVAVAAGTPRPEPKINATQRGASFEARHIVLDLVEAFEELGPARSRSLGRNGMVVAPQLNEANDRSRTLSLSLRVRFGLKGLWASGLLRRVEGEEEKEAEEVEE